MINQAICQELEVEADASAGTLLWKVQIRQTKQFLFVLQTRTININYKARNLQTLRNNTTNTK